MGNKKTNEGEIKMKQVEDFIIMPDDSVGRDTETVTISEGLLLGCERHYMEAIIYDDSKTEKYVDIMRQYT